MSWEVDKVEKFPCPCGEGEYTVTNRSDDWGRFEISYHMDCEKCALLYEATWENYSTKGIGCAFNGWKLAV